MVRGLVEQEELGFLSDERGERDALPFTAGKARYGFFGVLTDAEAFERAVSSGARTTSRFVEAVARGAAHMPRNRHSTSWSSHNAFGCPE